jgi:hypothetical protein
VVPEFGLPSIPDPPLLGHPLGRHPLGHRLEHEYQPTSAATLAIGKLCCFLDFSTRLMAWRMAPSVRPGMTCLEMQRARLRKKMLFERIVAKDTPGQEKAGVIDYTSCRALQWDGRRSTSNSQSEKAPNTNRLWLLMDGTEK